MWNSSTCDCECNKACIIDDFLDIQNCSCEKCLIGKLVLACGGEILYITETSLADKNNGINMWKNNCLINTISIIIMCFCYYLLFLLVAITIMQNIG